jgi:hypothetical protein
LPKKIMPRQRTFERTSAARTSMATGVAGPAQIVNLAGT